ncbi:hypothetical protein FB45DRAFT_866627 [Roridomyces roridus]|uniref:Uncharacterized protein n=1 Tax=Roridomyces roridus TaxID=1738132 RepID=A0AAD7BXS7_9AGAR|nr:hypothetical protein FB45DRAFT_866627 [Roridomyces roridus]
MESILAVAETNGWKPAEFGWDSIDFVAGHIAAVAHVQNLYDWLDTNGLIVFASAMAAGAPKKDYTEGPPLRFYHQGKLTTVTDAILAKARKSLWEYPGLVEAESQHQLWMVAKLGDDPDVPGGVKFAPDQLKVVSAAIAATSGLPNVDALLQGEAARLACTARWALQGLNNIADNNGRSDLVDTFSVMDNKLGEVFTKEAETERNVHTWTVDVKKHSFEFNQPLFPLIPYLGYYCMRHNDTHTPSTTSGEAWPYSLSGNSRTDLETVKGFEGTGDICRAWVGIGTGKPAGIWGSTRTRTRGGCVPVPAGTGFVQIQPAYGLKTPSPGVDTAHSPAWRLTRGSRVPRESSEGSINCAVKSKSNLTGNGSHIMTNHQSPDSDPWRRQTRLHLATFWLHLLSTLVCKAGHYQGMKGVERRVSIKSNEWRLDAIRAQNPRSIWKWAELGRRTGMLQQQPP